MHVVASIAAATARWLASGHFAALVAQIFFAIAMVAGHGEFFVLHSRFALIVAEVAAIQAVLFLFLWSLGRVSWLYLGYAVLSLLLALLQARNIVQLTAVQHVTLAMIYWGLSLAILVRVWTPSWNEAGSDANP
jgi:hypothetical protein